MFDECKLAGIISDWAKKHEYNGAVIDLYDELYMFIHDTISGLAMRDPDSITDEKAINHLHNSGWMAKHDAAMSFDSLTAVVNNLMRAGNKSISVSIYPCKDTEDD